MIETARVSGVDSARMRSVGATGCARYGGLPSRDMGQEKCLPKIALPFQALHGICAGCARWCDKELWRTVNAYTHWACRCRLCCGSGMPTFSAPSLAGCVFTVDLPRSSVSAGTLAWRDLYLLSAGSDSPAQPGEHFVSKETFVFQREQSPRRETCNLALQNRLFRAPVRSAHPPDSSRGP